MKPLDDMQCQVLNASKLPGEQTKIGGICISVCPTLAIPLIVMKFRLMINLTCHRENFAYY